MYVSRPNKYFNMQDCLYLFEVTIQNDCLLNSNIYNEIHSKILKIFEL